jgi:hypothetical protein
LASAFEHAVSTDKAPQIELKIFWGGHKEMGVGTANESDAQVLDRFKEVVDSLQKIGVNARIKLLFSDLHSEKINGIERERIEKYYDSLFPLARERNFGVERLSDLWTAYNPFGKWFEQPQPGEENPPEPVDALGFASKTLSILEKLGLVEKSAGVAAKHSKEVAKGAESALNSSEKYSAVMTVEKYILDRHRKAGTGTFFISLSDPRTSALHRPQYTLHFWSLKRGSGKTPWFE